MATLLPLVEEDERNAKRGGGSSAPGSRQMTPDSAFPSEQDADGSSCNNPCHATIPSFAFFSSSSNFYSSHFGIRTCVVGEIVVQACALRAITFSSFFSLRNNPPSVFPINFRSTFSSTSQPLFLAASSRRCSSTRCSRSSSQHSAGVSSPTTIGLLRVVLLTL